MLIYGVYKLQEIRKRPIRLTEILDTLYYLPWKWFGIAFYDSAEEYRETLDRLVEGKYLEKRDDGYIVTEKGKGIVEALNTVPSSYIKMFKKYIDEVIEAYTKVSSEVIKTYTEVSNKT